MKVALIQAPLIWESIANNLAYFERELDKVEVGTNLVVLPEMFTTGFTMTPQNCFITMDGEELKVLKQICINKNFALTGSLVVKEEGKFYNRLVFIFPDGSLAFYDKRHLFSLAGEHLVYDKGKNRLIVEYMGWRICPLVCYDLRFPVFARNVDQQYDLLIYVASWPDQRINAWNCLLKARAIENMSYVVGVNRCGEDQNDNIYSGHSQAIDYLGNDVVSSFNAEQLVYCQIDLALQNKARNRFKFLQDAD